MMPMIMSAPGFMQEEKYNHYLPDQALSAVLASSDYSMVTNRIFADKRAPTWGVLDAYEFQLKHVLHA
jgi:hypothetical protein